MFQDRRRNEIVAFSEVVSELGTVLRSFAEHDVTGEKRDEGGKWTAGGGGGGKAPEAKAPAAQAPAAPGSAKTAAAKSKRGETYPPGFESGAAYEGGATAEQQHQSDVMWATNTMSAYNDFFAGKKIDENPNPPGSMAARAWNAEFTHIVEMANLAAGGTSPSAGKVWQERIGSVVGQRPIPEHLRLDPGHEDLPTD
jgi:hypothetical protein